MVAKKNYTIKIFKRRKHKIITLAQPDEEMLDFLDQEEAFSKH